MSLILPPFPKPDLCWKPSYQPAGALRFRGGYLQTPPLVGDRQRFSFVAWAAPAKDAATWLGANNQGSAYEILGPTNSRGLQWSRADASWGVGTARTLRDIVWYPTLLSVDTTQADAANRVRLFLGWDQDNDATGQPAQDYQHRFMLNGYPLFIGGYASYLGLFKGYQCDPMVISGAALEPADVFAVGPAGEPVPMDPAQIAANAVAKGGSVLCHYPFSDPANPGLDASGAGNHATASGVDATDTVGHTPSDVYSVLNSLTADSTIRISDGNLVYDRTSNVGYRPASTSIPLYAGQYYAEATMTYNSNNALFGVQRLDGWAANGDAYTDAAHYLAINYLGEITSDGGSLTSGQPNWDGTAGCALDADTGEVTFISPAGAVLGPFALGGDGPVVFFTLSHIYSGQIALNCGQHPFVHTSPPDHVAPTTANLPAPEIKDVRDAFAAVAGATVTGDTLQAELDAAAAWSEFVEIGWNRAGGLCVLRTTLRGQDKAISLAASPTAEAAFAGYAGTALHLGWRWRTGSRYGCQAQVVTKTVAGAETFAHGLGRQVGMLWAVDLAGGDVYCQHRAAGGSKWWKVNGGAVTTGSGPWADTAATATNFTLGTTFPAGAEVLVIAWAVLPGYADFGRYDGINSNDGPFAPTTTQPVAFMVNGSNYAPPMCFDTTRDPINYCRHALRVDGGAESVSASEGTNTNTLDIDTGGVKARGYGGQTNVGGQEHFWAAWGRPIGGQCIAPAVAR